MKRRDFDAIVIGGGVNGMTMANYLRRAGLDVAIFERKLEVGGGLTTEEPIIPGVWHNFQHTFHGPIYDSPMVVENDLHGFNSQWIIPTVQASNFLGSGKSVTIYDDVERTANSIDALSKADGKAWRELASKYAGVTRRLLIDSQYVRPSKLREFRSQATKDDAGREALRWSAMSPIDVANELFENDGVKALVLNQMAMPRGIVPDYKGYGLSVLGVITGVEVYSFCLGGSHVFGQSLWRGMMSSGCAILGMSEVEEILIDGGRATGVRLRDGRVFNAKFVVSGVDLEQTFLNLVGAGNLDQSFVSRLKSRSLDEFSVFGVHVVHQEPAKYQVESPDVDVAWTVNVGLETPAQIMKMFETIRSGAIPEPPQIYVSTPTILDHSTAPTGIHASLIWQLVPYELEPGGADAWTQELKKEKELQALGAWTEAAASLQQANIIGSISFSPKDLSGKWISMPRGAVFQGGIVADPPEDGALFDELLDYRTPIENLYICGAANHPSTGIIGAPAHNAFTVISEDQDLKVSA